MTLEEAPVRLCCYQRHWGLVCPDGKVMCCLCFDRFAPEELWTDEDGQKWDSCKACGDHDAEIAERLEEQQ